LKKVVSRWKQNPLLEIVFASAYLRLFSKVEKVVFAILFSKVEKVVFAILFSKVYIYILIIIMDSIQLWKNHRQFIDNFIGTNMQPAIHYLNDTFSAINKAANTYATFIGAYALKNILNSTSLPENDHYIYHVTNIDGLVLVNDPGGFARVYTDTLRRMTELVGQLNTQSQFAGVYHFAVEEVNRGITNNPIYLFEGRIINIRMNQIISRSRPLTQESKNLFTALNSSSISGTSIISISIERATNINIAACKHFLPVEQGSPILGWRGYILFSSFLPQWNEHYPVALVSIRQKLIYSFAARFHENELYEMILGVEIIFRNCALFYTFRASTIFKEMLIQNNVILYPTTGNGGAMRYVDFEEWFNNICLQQIATPYYTNLRYILNTVIRKFDQWLVANNLGICVKSGGEALRYYDPIRIISTNDIDAKIYFTALGITNITHIYQIISNILVFINTLIYKTRLVSDIIANIQTNYTFKFSGKDFIHKIISSIPGKRYNSRIRVMELNGIRKLFSMDIFAIAQIAQVNLITRTIDYNNLFNIKIQASPLDLAFQKEIIAPYIVRPENKEDMRHSRYYSTTPTGMKISSLGYIRADVAFLLTNLVRILAGKHEKDIRRMQLLDNIDREKGTSSDETWLNNPNNKELVEKLDLRNDPLDTTVSSPMDAAYQHFKVILNSTLNNVINYGVVGQNALSDFGTLFTPEDVAKMTTDLLAIQPSFTSDQKSKTIQDGGKRRVAINKKKKSSTINKKKRSTIKKKSGIIKKKSTMKRRDSFIK